jgi:hypothetical protein
MSNMLRWVLELVCDVPLVGFPEAAAELVEVCIWPLGQMIEQSFNCLYARVPTLQKDRAIQQLI